MSVEFDFSGDVVLITGVGGALGSAVAEAFLDADATVCGADVVAERLRGRAAQRAADARDQYHIAGEVELD